MNARDVVTLPFRLCGLQHLTALHGLAKNKECEKAQQWVDDVITLHAFESIHDTCHI